MIGKIKEIGIFYGFGRKLLILLLVFSLLPLGVVSISGYWNSKEVIREQTLDYLLSVAKLRKERLVDYIREQKTTVESIVLGNKYLYSTVKMLQALNLGSSDLDQVRTDLNDYLWKKSEENKNFREVFVVGLKGQVIASSEIEQIGEQREDRPYFVRAREGVYVTDIYYSLSLAKPTMAVSAPIQDDRGNFGGVFVARVSLDEMRKVLEDREGLGKTGETYLVNKDGFLISESRFAKDLILKQRVETEGVRDCLAGNDGVGVYRDYRGVKVVGSYLWIPEQRWALMAEIDEAEAFFTLTWLRKHMIIWGIILFFCLTVAAAYIARGVTNPMRHLASSVRKVGEGNLDEKVDVASKDEVGQLAFEFNRMTAKLEAYYSELKGEIRRQEQYLANIMTGSADAIFSMDTLGKITSWNKGAETIFGYKAEEMIGEFYLRLIPEEKRFEMEELDRSVREKGHVANYITERLTKEGKRIVVNITKTAILDENGKLIGSSVIMKDITDIKKMEEHLAQSEKLASVGQLAAGIAHEIGTPLNVISGCAEYLLMDLDKDEVKAEELKTIVAQTDKITKMMRRILDFARPRELDFTQVNVNNLLKNILQLTERQLAKSDIEVLPDLQPDLPEIRGDENQLQQVFLNILMNAWQALEDEGKSSSGRSLSITAKQSDEFVEVVFADTGCGISEENLKRVFDPFFTTKEVGKGTGLGLAVSQRIIGDHEGTIAVESREGMGTTVTVKIPIAIQDKENV